MWLNLYKYPIVGMWLSYHQLKLNHPLSIVACIGRESMRRLSFGDNLRLSGGKMNIVRKVFEIFTTELKRFTIFLKVQQHKKCSYSSDGKDLTKVLKNVTLTCRGSN